VTSAAFLVLGGLVSDRLGVPRSEATPWKRGMP
jgi:hypothetical protein